MFIFLLCGLIPIHFWFLKIIILKFRAETISLFIS